MPIFRFMNFIFIFCFIFTNAIASGEENVLFSKKGKKPIYAKIKYDKHGNRKSISFIQVDENSEHLVEMEGLAIAKIRYSKTSKTFKVKEYDIDKNLLFTDKVQFQDDGFELTTYLGKRKNGKSLFKKIKYNLDGDKILDEYFDGSKKPAANKRKISKTKYEYNANGKRTLTEYYDTKGNLIGDSKGIARYENIYDARGNKIASKFFDEKGKPKENKDGIAIESFTYDYANWEKGKLILQENFNSKRLPKGDSKGIASYLYNYDQKGNRILIEYRDEKGRLKEDWKGFAKYIFGFSDSGEVIKEEEYGGDGKLKLDPADGIARSISELEVKDNTTIKTTKFYDAQGKLKINEVLEVAIVKTTTTTSKDGKEVKTEYFDTEGKPKFSGENYAIMLQKYDVFGNEIQEEYFDKNNSPTNSRDGYAKYTASFKEKDLLSEEYFTTEGKLIEGDDGFAKQIRTYNSLNKLALIENFDSEGKYIQSNLGFAKMIINYNSKGNKIEEIFLNAKLEPVSNSEGISKVQYEYNKACLSLSKEEDCYSLVQSFDPKGNPVGNKRNIAKTISIFDDSGKIQSTQTYLVGGEKQSRKMFSFEFGNKKEIAWELYKNEIIHRGVYHVYLRNPNSASKPLVKITLNKLYRPISIKLAR